MKVTIEFDNSADAEVALRALNVANAPAESPPAVVVDLATGTPQKRGRKPRVAAEPRLPPPPPEPVGATPGTVPAPSSAFDDDAPTPSSFLEEDEPAKVATKDDVRAALVGLQLKRHGQYVAKGQDEKTAAANAEAAAKAVLVSVGGSERLGTLDEKKYGAVVEAANKEAAK